MLKEMVDKAVERYNREFVSGEFYIGLDSIKQFAYFYVIALYNHRHVKTDVKSVRQFLKDPHFDKIREEEEKNDIAGCCEGRLYERKLDHYNTLNREKMLEASIRRKEGYSDDRGARFGGIKIYESQFEEFKILDDVKEYKILERYNLTYKRLNSENEYLHKITFSELREFVKLLKTEIDESEEEYKNTRYYKLEKRLGFELIKSQLKCISICREMGLDADRTVNDMIPLFLLPMISDRQKYAELYPTLDSKERDEWRMEIEGIIRFVHYVAIHCSEVLVNKELEHILTEGELESFKAIYTKGTFENEFKMRKDFSAKDFKDLMKGAERWNKS